MKTKIYTVLKYFKFLLPLIIALTFSFSQTLIQAQTLDSKIRGQLEEVGRYVIAADDNTNTYLNLLKFQRPEYISSVEWNAFPAARKIDMAYKAAAINGYGNQFIEGFAKLVSKDYNSIKSEESLKSFFIGNEIPDVKYKYPSLLGDFQKIPVPANIKTEILTVGKYVNEGALGSLQSVFKNYMNLNEDVIYDILTKSSSNAFAFEQGLLRSVVPPPHDVKLTRMASDLQKNYKGLEKDIKLSEISKKKTPSSFSFIEEDIKPTELPSMPSLNNSNPSKKGITLNEYKSKFKTSYVKHANYENVYINRSKSFKGMRNFIGGHGGVILGDSIKYMSIPGLIEIRWRPINDSAKEDYKKIGYLEFYFKNSKSYKTYGPVLYEDVFAANAVVSDSGYKYGNGIGMVSIIDSSNVVFSDQSRRFGVTLHPVVSHMRLGWAFVIVDALASAKKSFENVMENDSDKKLLNSFYAEKNSTWKITDKKITINNVGNSIKIDNIVLGMWGFRGSDTIPKISQTFDKLLPSICNSVQEYNRVNEFAKVLAIFRWAKISKSKISNIETYNSFIKQPICIYINSSEEFEFYDIQKDHEAITNEKKYFMNLLEFNKTDTNKIYSAKIDSLIIWTSNVSKNREFFWNLKDIPPTNFSLQIVNYLKNEDTSGIEILTDILRIYKEKWVENNIKYNNPDSLEFYRMLAQNEKASIAPLYILYDKEDSVLKKINGIYTIYNIKQRSDLFYLPSTVQKTLVDNFNLLTEIRSKEKSVLKDPKINDAYYEKREFEIRNKVVSIRSFYSLLEAEKKIIRDYSYE